MPISARYAMSVGASPAVAPSAEAPPKMISPMIKARATTEAVTEGAGREQERGEGERVGVDDPLLLRLAGVEAGGEMGEAVGEHRDAGDHHHEREAHHREDRRAVGEGRRHGGRGVRARSAQGFHGWHSLSRASGGAAARHRERYSEQERFGCCLRYYTEASSGLQGGFG